VKPVPLAKLVKPAKPELPAKMAMQDQPGRMDKTEIMGKPE
jgi:hypothetical protein